MSIRSDESIRSDKHKSGRKAQHRSGADQGAGREQQDREQQKQSKMQADGTIRWKPLGLDEVGSSGNVTSKDAGTRWNGKGRYEGVESGEQVKAWRRLTRQDATMRQLLSQAKAGAAKVYRYGEVIPKLKAKG